MDNNYANDSAEDDESPVEFLKHRAAAYQAHYEWSGDHRRHSLQLGRRFENGLPGAAVARSRDGTRRHLITSGGDGRDSDPAVEAYLRENPQIKLYNSQRGYVSCEVTRNTLTADFRVLEKVSVPDAPMSTRARFITENGKPGAVRA